MKKKKIQAGRKKIDPKEIKIPVQVYIETKKVEQMGGMEEARKVALGALENESNKA